MDLRRLSQGERIAAVSALLLLPFTFLDWYSVTVPYFGPSLSAGGNAWDTLEVMPILLVVAIAGTLLMALLKLGQAEVELAIDGPRIVAVLGAASFALILYRLIEPPRGASALSWSPQIGIFLSLLAAAGMAFGGWRAMREEGFWLEEPAEGPSGEGGGEESLPVGSPEASADATVSSTATERPSVED